MKRIIIFPDTTGEFKPDKNITTMIIHPEDSIGNRCAIPAEIIGVVTDGGGHCIIGVIIGGGD